MLPRRFFPVVVVLLAGCASSHADSQANVAPGDADSAPPSAPPASGGGDAGSPQNDGAVAPIADAAGSPDAGPTSTDGGPTLTTIRVHYPAGTHAVVLRGSVPPFDWLKGAALVSGANDTWTLSTTAVAAPLEFKPLLDDATWSRGPNYKVAPGATVDVYPHFTTVKGSYSRAYDFPSTLLGNSRGIWIYKPPSYDENTTARFPVVYMHDGQNVFDATTAFGGNEWKIDETMDAAAEDGTIAEAIVIGVENTSARMSEYTPVPDATQSPAGGDGAKYVQMLAQELKPKIDSTLRTIADRDHTFMMGSSLGGLISAYAGVERGDVFGGIGALSPSTWWDNDWIVGEAGTAATKPTRSTKVYVDSGDSGPSNDDVTQTATLAANYRTAGYVDGTTLDYLVQKGGQHSEVYWAQRAPGALAFLLGARSP